jgi:hypothetical protein
MRNLDAWAKRHGITLFYDAERPNIIAFFISHKVETVQVVLEDKGNDFVADIWSIETKDDEEFHYRYNLRAAELDSELDEIVRKIRSWFLTREKLGY